VDRTAGRSGGSKREEGPIASTSSTTMAPRYLQCRHLRSPETSWGAIASSPASVAPWKPSDAIARWRLRTAWKFATGIVSEESFEASLSSIVLLSLSIVTLRDYFYFRSEDDCCCRRWNVRGFDATRRMMHRRGGIGSISQRRTRRVRWATRMQTRHRRSGDLGGGHCNDGSMSRAIVVVVADYRYGDMMRTRTSSSTRPRSCDDRMRRLAATVRGLR